MSQATLGLDFIIQYNKGTAASPEYVVLGGQRGASLSQSTETFDIGMKGAEGWKDYIAGSREWSISADGLYLVDDESFELFNRAYLNRKKLKINIVIPKSSKQYEGEVLIENLDIDMNYDDVVTYSTSLLGCGALSIVVNQAIIEALGYINEGTPTKADFDTIGVEGVSVSSVSTINAAITEARTKKGSDLTISEIQEVVYSLQTL